jgi:HD-like signal output (HDOD) protein
MSVGKGQANNTISRENASEFLKNIDIPSCPSIVTDVLNLAKSDMPDLRKLANIVAGDVAISAAAIKMANSPMFRSGSPISSVHQAINLLGIRNTITVVASVALRNTGKGLPAQFLDEFWSRASTTALGAALIARYTRAANPETAYTYGLFHDAAIPIMMLRFSDYPAAIIEKAKQNNISLTEQENISYNCTHPVVGSIIVRTWGLPLEISLAIRAHHDEDPFDERREELTSTVKGLIAVTQLAEFLLNELRHENSLEITPEQYDQAVAYLEIDGTDLAEIHDLLEPLIKL